MDRPPDRRFIRLLWGAHRTIWNLSGGRLGGRILGLPVLELVTTGRKSGEQRSILINYIELDEGVAVAGTNAGADHDAAWVLNLRADQRARVRRDGAWRDVRARFATGDEWDRVWSRFAEFEAYRDYRAMLDRPIPLVILQDGN